MDLISNVFDWLMNSREDVVVFSSGFLMAFGVLGVIFYTFKLMVRAFTVHVLWGLAYLLIPFAALVFIFKHWEEAEQPFKGMLKSFLIIAFGLAASILIPEYFL